LLLAAFFGIIFCVLTRFPRWIFEVAGIYDQIAGNCGKIAGSPGKFEEKTVGALIKLVGN
jgi:hypothetical protein